MTVAMKTGHAESRASALLSREEHNILLSLIGAKCQSLSTCVVQLFLTDGPDHSQWRRKDAGVLCFVKDHYRRSYFFRLYCLTRRSLIWEQQVYNDMDYQTPRPWLHTFEAEYTIVAFNFANDDEADGFKRVVQNQIEAKRQRRMERRSRASMGDIPPGSMPNLTVAAVGNKHHRSASSGASAATPIHKSHKPHKKEKESAAAARRRIKKEDIGLPQDFRHVSHVGWDPNKGFDVDLDQIQDQNLKAFFAKAGVSDSQLQDRDTREFIYQFIQDNGGLAAVREEVVPPGATRAPPVPTRAPPSHKPSPPPPPPTRVCPPTPVSQQRSAPPPPPPPSTKPANQNTVMPPPPPPMPMMDVAVVSAPSPPGAPGAPSKAPPPAADPRSALLDAIKSGKSLKHVEVEKRAIPDSRGELLDQIRQGVELKSVQPNERSNVTSLPSDGLAGALARALAERNKAFHDSDSDSDSDSAESDSEWED